MVAGAILRGVLAGGLIFWFLGDALRAQTPGTLDRPRDPIVIAGGDVPWMLGVRPGEIVAFRYTRSRWEQVPVQVDERTELDFGLVYGDISYGYTALQYPDPGTFAGSDPDPLLDSDDEIALLARSSGDRPPCPGAGEPAGVVPGSGVEIEATDPLTLERGWIHLFRSDGSLDPSAGQPDVDYRFLLLSGPYLTTYDTRQGPNPEDSRVVTPSYSMHFSDRWVRDELRITVGSSSGADILDRHRNLFGPGSCTRSEDTFSAGEGAFYANRTGPVRAIRAFLGANSGPFTERTHWFYEARHDVRTVLRVHAIPGMMDLYDLSWDAMGMTYYDRLNPGGFPVDGTPDPALRGDTKWAFVTGLQGTLLSSMALETDLPGLDTTSWYEDDLTPTHAQCTGDDYEIAASGAWIASSIPSTDPSNPPAGHLVAWRVDTFDSPGADPAVAQGRRAQSFAPVETVATPYCCGPPCCEAVRIAPIANLRASRSGQDVLLAWTGDPHASGYNVWRAVDPMKIPEMHAGGTAPAVDSCAPTLVPACTDAGAGAPGGDPLRFYSVRGTCGSEEAAE